MLMTPKSRAWIVALSNIIGEMSLIILMRNLMDIQMFSWELLIPTVLIPIIGGFVFSYNLSDFSANCVEQYYLNKFKHYAQLPTWFGTGYHYFRLAFMVFAITGFRGTRMLNVELFQSACSSTPILKYVPTGVAATYLVNTSGFDAEVTNGLMTYSYMTLIFFAAALGAMIWFEYITVRYQQYQRAIYYRTKGLE